VRGRRAEQRIENVIVAALCPILTITGEHPSPPVGSGITPPAGAGGPVAPARAAAKAEPTAAIAATHRSALATPASHPPLPAPRPLERLRGMLEG
jgi:hypothetical protein